MISSTNRPVLPEARLSFDPSLSFIAREGSGDRARETTGVPDNEPRPPLPPGPFLVVGLARSGQAAARVLAARGETVIGTDSGSPAGAAELREAGVEVRLETDGVEGLGGTASVIKSPGVPASAPVIAAARERGLPVIGELDLSWRLLSNRFCAVTGTNGKTTVAELLGDIWRTAGHPVVVAGNVGTPLASLVGEVDPNATIVCEASSFQLEDADAFAPECGILLNLTPDHLDRHRDFEDYRDAKLRVFANQGADDVCVYNASDPALAGLELGGRGRRAAFCSGAHGSEDCRAVVDDGRLLLDGAPLLELDELALLGPHNAANAAAAAAAATAMGIERAALAAGLRSFGGVAHRLERVAEIDGVRYVNDSKATNAAAAAAALRSFEGGVRAILGGSLKGGEFGALAEPVADRCAGCYLIGEACERIEHDLATAWAAGVPRRRCEGLAEAVRTAAADSSPGEVVLLAPGCASFDAYRDFEQRGEHFRALVEELR
jgi:UDP-N-acetylmuramoylalanine--D-glutamate ligase